MRVSALRVRLRKGDAAQRRFDICAVSFGLDRCLKFLLRFGLRGGIGRCVLEDRFGQFVMHSRHVRIHFQAFSVMSDRPI